MTHLCLQFIIWKFQNVASIMVPSLAHGLHWSQSEVWANASQDSHPALIYFSKVFKLSKDSFFLFLSSLYSWYFLIWVCKMLLTLASLNFYTYHCVIQTCIMIYFVSQHTFIHVCSICWCRQNCSRDGLSSITTKYCQCRLLQHWIWSKLNFQHHIQIHDWLDVFQLQNEFESSGDIAMWAVSYRIFYWG